MTRLPVRRGFLGVAIALACSTVLSACGLVVGNDGPTVRVYSARTYGSEKAYEKFTDETGIDVEFLNGSDAELRERLKAEGTDTKADVYMTVDAANLALAKEQGLLRAITSPTLDKAVPENLRDPEGRWFSLSVRARAIVYNKDRVEPADITTYEALEDERWRGKLCLRTSTSAYTQSLVASFVAEDGVEGARRIVDGWVANSPQVLANDVEILRTLAAGGCDVGITNHYYLARELAKDPDMPVGLAWPNQKTTGTHVNVSGAGVTTHAKYPAEAQRFLEWMATTGQPTFVEGNFEFPVNPEVELHPILESFGPYRRDELNVGELGQHNAQAVQVLTDAGYR